MSKFITKQVTSGAEFIHHEIDEFVDPSFVKELHQMAADRLFRLWLKSKKKDSGDPNQVYKKAA